MIVTKGRNIKINIKNQVNLDKEVEIRSRNTERIEINLDLQSLRGIEIDLNNEII